MSQPEGKKELEMRKERKGKRVTDLVGQVKTRKWKKETKWVRQSVGVPAAGSSWRDGD